MAERSSLTEGRACTLNCDTLVPSLQNTLHHCSCPLSVCLLWSVGLPLPDPLGCFYSIYLCETLFRPIHSMHCSASTLLLHDDSMLAMGPLILYSLFHFDTSTRPLLNVLLLKYCRTAPTLIFLNDPSNKV